MLLSYILDSLTNVASVTTKLLLSDEFTLDYLPKMP